MGVRLETRQYLVPVISTMLIWGLEYYDIIIYSSLAYIIQPLFFSSSPLVGLLEVWGAFALSYLVRPLGAVIFGHLGDTRGRRYTTILDAGLIGLAAVVIGLLPPYSAIGLAAPLAFYSMRILQGLSLGGEAGGGATWAMEVAPVRLKPILNGVMYSGLSWAVFLSSFMVLTIKGALPPSAFNAWGWRVIYAFGAVPALIALIIRLSGVESPEWVEAKRAGKLPRLPLASVVRRHWRALLIVILINLGLTMYYYGGTGFWSYAIPKLIAPHVGVTPSKALDFALTLSMYGGLGAVTGEVLSGFLLNKIGIRPLFIASAIALMVISPLGVNLSFSFNPLAPLISLIMGILFGLAAAPQTLYFTSLFPVEARWSGVSFGWNINAAIGPLSTLLVLLLMQGAPSAAAFASSAVMIISAALVVAGAIPSLKRG
ncbi:MFS transporter [Thermocladium modestius]|uniref:MFS transporter n=1 Tax=Thermocladium modestius TaxID=62609 RepID=A0A830GXC0_9CREN|nr:MFS transporter [Thermocladium modestius]GGP21181.1 MFS transporter [Thermocladium modestius]